MKSEHIRAVVDGNAAAGILSEVFAGDVTLLAGGCGGCGASAPLAEALVELDDVCAIVRCRGCTRTLLTVLRTGSETQVVIGTLRQFVATAAIVTGGDA